MNIKTKNLCDNRPETVQVADPIKFTDFGGKKDFYGKILFKKCFENNSVICIVAWSLNKMAKKKSWLSVAVTPNVGLGMGYVGRFNR